MKVRAAGWAGSTAALVIAAGCVASPGTAAPGNVMRHGAENSAAARSAAGQSAHSSAQRSARHFRGVPTVGALFLPGLYPTLHTCTASVVSSRRGDIIMTAAHCMSGSGAGYRFVPGYRNGKAPYGVWSVTGAYGDPAWISQQDPHRDWAFLTVAARRIGGKSRSLQSVTGGHRLGYAARRGDEVRVIGYGVGRRDEPIRCRARVYRHAGYPAFNCGGFVGGTSGSPWLRSARSGPVVVGDIGGLHQGGCTPSTSYSPPLGAPAHRALRRAEHGGPPNVFPAAGPDGCS